MSLKRAARDAIYKLVVDPLLWLGPRVSTSHLRADSVYKIISDAIQQTQLGGADPQATATSASKQLDAFLATYRGAPMM